MEIFYTTKRHHTHTHKRTYTGTYGARYTHGTYIHGTYIQVDKYQPIRRSLCINNCDRLLPTRTHFFSMSTAREETRNDIRLYNRVNLAFPIILNFHTQDKRCFGRADGG